jgi:hypothetical protein
MNIDESWSQLAFELNFELCDDCSRKSEHLSPLIIPRSTYTLGLSVFASVYQNQYLSDTGKKMGSSLSKARKAKVNKVLPEITAENPSVRRIVDEDTLPPLQISASKSNLRALPAIMSSSQKHQLLDDRPDSSILHANDDDEDEFQNALDADLQLNLDQDRNYTDDEYVFLTT